MKSFRGRFMYCVKLNTCVWQYETALEAWNNKPLQVRRGDRGNFDEFARLLDSGKTLQFHALTVWRVMKTAYLYNDGEFTIFQVGRQVIRFRTSPYLEKYTEIKEYDNGYIVVMSKLSTLDAPEEDYIDMEYIFRKLELDKGVLSEIGEVLLK
jgi:hypothetical protein